MFESVGRAPRRRRGFIPFLLTILVNGSAAAALLWVGTRAATEPAKAAESVERYVPLSLPPSAAPAGERHAATPRHGHPQAPAPEAPAPTPEVQPEPPGPTDAQADAEVGTPGGPGGGPEGAGGGEGGSGGGDCPTCAAPAVRVVHWSEARPLRRVVPNFPTSARLAGIREADCVVRFSINGDGVPTDVALRGCPAPFDAVTAEAARQWRFEPVQDGGHGVAVQFELKIRYEE